MVKSMSLLGESNASLDPNWIRGKHGRFHFFYDLDPEEESLEGVSGVFVIWHGGVRPEWVYIGKSKNLAATFHKLGENEEIAEYEVNGRLFVSWSLVRPKYQDGVLRYLNGILKPAVENPGPPEENVEPIPIYAPGYAAEETP
ncbi:MAG TPA: hypothetical protein ENI79_05500 [Rhodospirillales bacterium]|nr:hypothetical protein [Rhodospirillales bacterium]